MEFMGYFLKKNYVIEDVSIYKMDHLILIYLKKTFPVTIMLKLSKTVLQLQNVLYNISDKAFNSPLMPNYLILI